MNNGEEIVADYFSIEFVRNTETIVRRELKHCVHRSTFTLIFHSDDDGHDPEDFSFQGCVEKPL
jgi:hypothetical protein